MVQFKGGCEDLARKLFERVKYFYTPFDYEVKGYRAEIGIVKADEINEHIYYVAKGGHLDLIKKLLTFTKDYDVNWENIVRGAASGNHLDIIIFAFDNATIAKETMVEDIMLIVIEEYRMNIISGRTLFCIL